MGREHFGGLGRAIRLVIDARRAVVRGEDPVSLLRAALEELGFSASQLSLPRVEGQLEVELGAPSSRLASYGSLRPGERHHDVVAEVAGRWLVGSTTGHLGELEGYPVLDWAADGPVVEVAVLHSSDLPSHWSAIDAFEGPGYVRAFVPVLLTSGETIVCSCYVAADGLSRLEPRDY